MRDPVKEATDDLAAEARNRQFDNTVTAEEAMDHVCEETATKWVSTQWGLQSAQSLLIEMIEKHMDENVARDLFASLLNAMTASSGAEAQAGRTLLDALKLHMAEDLAYEAQKAVDNYEPTDDEMSRDHYAPEVDDPVRVDRRHYAEINRASAGYYRRTGEYLDVL